jgi:hypothetical protein
MQFLSDQLDKSEPATTGDNLARYDELATRASDGDALTEGEQEELDYLTERFEGDDTENDSYPEYDEEYTSNVYENDLEF